MSQEPTISQDAAELERSQQRSTQRARPPLEVPGYEFERFLGSGAFGEVWVAVERNTGRRVALKFYVRRGGVDWGLLSREVEKLAFLFADRYVVQLIDVGWDANPPYYVMEYLERGSLADRLQSGPIPVGEALGLFRDVAVGLVHAHDKGVLHCDLKPANVLLDSDGRPRLADFGQSRMSHEQTPALGTLFYMAPEQADRSAVPDARWDVYALGSLLYCMLTGNPPHRSAENITLIDKSPDVADKLESYRRLLQDAPAPTKHRQVPGVDRDLAEIIDRCLHTNPAKRFPNPQAVLAAFENRNLRRARRPLLVLGAIGPAVLLAVMTWLAWQTYGTAVRETDESLTRRALESDGFAAQFVAATVASEIERRFQTLEREVDDRDVRDLLTRIASQSAANAGDRRAVQTWLERAVQENPDVQGSSWSVMSAEGVQLARAPYDDKTIGKNFAFRHYFNGEGELAEGTKKNVAPINDVNLSNVFMSRSANDRRVSFSAPFWSNEPDAAKRRVVGVMAVAVSLGHFSELHADRSGRINQIAALVDLKPDSSGRAGSILEHPGLNEIVRELKPGDPFPEVYFDADRVARLHEAVHAWIDPTDGSGKGAETAPRLEDSEYIDPIGGEFAGPWLAAFRPVVLEDRPAKLRDTELVVVVQERRDEALRPAQVMGHKLVRYGLIALGVVIAVVTVLWGFVVVALNDVPGRPFKSLFNRAAGLPPASSSMPSDASVRDAAAATALNPMDKP